jgi:hypothetical protein
MKFDFRFPTCKTVAVASCLMTVLAIASATISLSQHTAMVRTVTMMEFYATAYEKFSDASDYYLYHSVYMIYGNFIKIDGEFASDKLEQLKDASMLSNLVNFFVSERHQIETAVSRFTGEDFEKFVFTDACFLLDETFDGPEAKKICQTYIPARSGFISFMNYEKDVLHEIRTVVSANRDFVERSKEEFLLFPFTDYLYKPEIVRFRMAADTLHMKLMELAFKAGDEGIRAELQRIKSLVVQLNILATSLLVLTNALFFVVAMALALKHDFDVCAETLRNMAPEILLQNKLLFQTFCKAFPVKLQ